MEGSINGGTPKSSISRWYVPLQTIHFRVASLLDTPTCHKSIGGRRSHGGNFTWKIAALVTLLDSAVKIEDDTSDFKLVQLLIRQSMEVNFFRHFFHHPVVMDDHDD